MGAYGQLPNRRSKSNCTPSPGFACCPQSLPEGQPRVKPNADQIGARGCQSNVQEGRNETVRGKGDARCRRGVPTRAGLGFAQDRPQEGACRTIQGHSEPALVDVPALDYLASTVNGIPALGRIRRSMGSLWRSYALKFTLRNRHPARYVVRHSSALGGRDIAASPAAISGVEWTAMIVQPLPKFRRPVAAIAKVRAKNRRLRSMNCAGALDRRPMRAIAAFDLPMARVTSSASTRLSRNKRAAHGKLMNHLRTRDAPH